MLTSTALVLLMIPGVGYDINENQMCWASSATDRNPASSIPAWRVESQPCR